tara:strand:- start:27 stop:608 length:582 start_codon:yes stop_codon:yes gene_type:complete
MDSRRKGHAFERSVARDLRLWLGPDWRVQRNLDDDQSGSRGRAGDILVDGPHTWPFCVECKVGYGLRSSHLWKGSTALSGMWAQARSQADAVMLDPLLVVKPQETAHPTLALMPPGCRRQLQVGGPVMGLRIGEEAVTATLWSELLRVAPLALLELAMWLEDRTATPAEVAAQTAQDLQRWQWLAEGGDDGTD